MIGNTTGMHPNTVVTTTGTGAGGIHPLGPSHIRPVRDEFYGDYDSNTLVMFKVRKIDNGFLLEYANYAGDLIKQIFAADPKDIGDLVVTKLVEKRLGE